MFHMSQNDCDNGNWASFQFLQIRKNQLIETQESLQTFCNVLPVPAFNSAKYLNLNLMKPFLLTTLVNEQDIEPTVVKKANQFILFNFGDIQLVHIMNFLGGATSLDSFLKASKTSEKQRIFPLRMV